MALDIGTIEHKLGKRGFRQDDVLRHECEACHAQAVVRYAVRGGRIGGRDISLCHACGAARSWRSAAGHESREEDVGFDLEAFLR
jgi:hypothetical protein